MTNFQKVVDFNKQFGNTVPETIQEKAFVDDPNTVKLCMSLIREEVKELEKAVTEHDMVETIDALSDILYVVYGMGARLGIDLDEAFDIVHESNMSKLCSTEEEAQQTVDFYNQRFKEGSLPYDSPTIRKSYDGSKYVVYNKSTGKVLKSIKYTPAKLGDMVQHYKEYAGKF